LIEDLPIPKDKRDKHNRPLVTPTLQLLDFPEVFAGGDCAAVKDNSLPPTAQVAYQQGAAIAYNLKAMALGHKLKPAEVSLRGTLLKLGIDNSVANIFDRFELTGELGHLIRQGTYLELLPTPVHDFKVTSDWLKDEIFHQHMHSGEAIETAVKVAGVVGGVVVSAIVAKKLLNALSDSDREQNSQPQLQRG
jgi:NADH dehydrogenase